MTRNSYHWQKRFIIFLVPFSPSPVVDRIIQVFVPLTCEIVLFPSFFSSSSFFGCEIPPGYRAVVPPCSIPLVEHEHLLYGYRSRSKSKYIYGSSIFMQRFEHIIYFFVQFFNIGLYTCVIAISSPRNPIPNTIGELLARDSCKRRDWLRSHALAKELEFFEITRCFALLSAFAVFCGHTHAHYIMMLLL